MPEHNVTAEEVARAMAKAYEPDLDWDNPAETDLLDRKTLTESAQKLLDSLAAASYRVERMPERSPDMRHTNRGFAIWEFPNADYRVEPERTVTVQESSLATEQRVWVGYSDGERMHLTIDAARELKDALSAWLDYAAPVATGGES